MKVDLNKIDDLNGELLVKLSPEDYTPQYEKSLQQYKKQAQFPGFRPGKVPTAIVKKKYGKSILAEEINKMINSGINNYIQENKIPVLGQPLPKHGADEGDWDNPVDFSFVFELGLAPTFDLKLTKRDKFTWNKIKVDDKLVEQQTSDYARRYGKLSEPEVAEDNDMVVGDLVELNADGNILEGGILANTTVSLEHLEDKASKKKIIGAKKEDQIVVDPKKLASDEADLLRMLSIDASQVDAISDKFQFNVKEIRRMQPAELNQELFDKILGEGKVSTEEEFKAEVANRIGLELENDSKRLFKKQLTDKLLDKLKLELPDDFLKRWIRASNEKPITEEQLEKDYPHYAQNLKWQLVENKIIEDNELKVEKEEVMAYAKETVAKQFAMYGIQQSDEEMEKIAENVLRDEKEGRKMYDELYEAKIVNFVKDAVKVEEKEVTFDEFLELAKAE